MSSVQRGVFLDRDGVINRSIVRNGKPYPPSSLETFEFLPKVSEAVALLKKAQFKIIVVTNQPDVATKKTTLELVNAMHDLVRTQLQVDDIKVCLHTDEHQCACRKPKPGMLIDAAREWKIDLKDSFIVGDRWRDIDAGKAAGCKTVLVGEGYPADPKTSADWQVPSLWDACAVIMREMGDKK